MYIYIIYIYTYIYIHIYLYIYICIYIYIYIYINVCIYTYDLPWCRMLQLLSLYKLKVRLKKYPKKIAFVHLVNLIKYGLRPQLCDS